MGFEKGFLAKLDWAASSAFCVLAWAPTYETGAIFLGFAFDEVPHERLVLKLSRLNLNPEIA